MRRACWIVVALLAGCSPPQSQREPSADTGINTGETTDPRNRAKLRTELASLYYGRGNMAVALEELRSAVAADPNYPTAYSMFGLVYMELKENRLAESNFQRALSLAPDDPDINHNYGWFLCQTGQETESLKYFEQAIRNPLYPAPWRSYSAAGVCALKKDNVKQAEEYFQRALRLEPDDPASLLQLGQIRYRQGDMAEARKMVGRFNKLVTPNAESLWLALRVERKLGERTAESSYATQLRRRYPASPEYQLMQRGAYD